MAVKVNALLSRTAVLLIYIFSYFSPSLSQTRTNYNTVTPGQVLFCSEKLLVSEDGRFQLGFFNVSHYPYSRCLGIQYAISKFYDDIVWVAKPEETSIHGSNISLTLDSDGLLKITRDGGKPILLNPDRTAPNSIATLENSGNLVVKELNHDGSVKQVLWESFDYPTDTLLPGMKLGKNLRTGKRWVLNSWLTEGIPAPGAFTLEFNQSEDGSRGVLVMRHRGALYKTMDKISDIFGNDSISYVSNESENYFNYSLDSLIFGLQLTPDGLFSYGNSSLVITELSWCYEYYLEYRCVGQRSPACRSNRDRIEHRQGRFLEDMSIPTSYVDDNSSINLSDCWARCWKNCSCVGFNTLYSDETGCRFWIKGAKFEETFFGTWLYVMNSSIPDGDDQKSESDSGLGKKRWIWFIISMVAVIVI